MIDRSSGRFPVGSFALPPDPPTPVREAFVRFDAVANRWGATRGELRDAQEEIKTAAAQGRRKAADAALAGKPTGDAGKLERQARERVAMLEAREEAERVAVDEAGNLLADAIAEHRGEGSEASAERADAAAHDVREAIARAQTVLRDYAVARAAVAWYNKFDRGEAHVGRQQQFSGGRVSVRTHELPGLRGHDLNPAVLLKIAATAVDPVEERKPGPLTVVAGSSK